MEVFFYDPYFKEKKGRKIEILRFFVKDLLTKIDEFVKISTHFFLVNR